MARMIYCRKYQREMEGLPTPPYPGPKGQDVFEHISKLAWQEWQAHQTQLINERRLSLMDAGTRKFLQEEMDKFFAGEDFAKAEGYVPPSQK